MRRSTLVFVLFLMAACMLPLPATHADQTDERLDGLFLRLHQTSDDGEAFALTQQIWQIWRQTEDAHATRMMAKGITAMHGQDYEEALSAFDEVVRVAPDFAEGWNKRATVHYLMDNLDASKEDIFETLRREPRHFGAISGLGLIFLEEGEEKLALGAFIKALKINPHLEDARGFVQVLKRKLGGQAI
ncbi:MAG: tetratricopeptide repeat protein [Alphaproteobacteria bacterium]|nr:tetratricopeptide repeat protein [Alphaproteobacteria bacterium]